MQVITGTHTVYIIRTRRTFTPKVAFPRTRPDYGLLWFLVSFSASLSFASFTYQLLLPEEEKISNHNRYLYLRKQMPAGSKIKPLTWHTRHNQNSQWMKGLLAPVVKSQSAGSGKTLPGPTLSGEVALYSNQHHALMLRMDDAPSDHNDAGPQQLCSSKGRADV